MIPIRNLYYLLLYAWDALEQGDRVGIEAEPSTKILDLLAAVLNRGIDHLLRRGLDRGYLARREAIPGLRGKFDVSSTIKRDLLTRASAVCEFDELSHDVPHNRILKATVRQLLRTEALSPQLREPLRGTYHRLHEVGEVRLTIRAFHSVQLHRNNGLYRFLLDVCRLLFECLIPDERTGTTLFRDFVRDENRMHGLFERFLRNFYRREQRTYTVRAERICWAATSGSAQDLALLPGMRTDISLCGQARKFVIDAKFYQETLQSHRSKQTVRSAHLYQLFAYLRNLSTPGERRQLDGLLLYPQTGRALNLTYEMHGHSISVRTIDLSRHWAEIRGDLLALLPADQ